MMKRLSALVIISALVGSVLAGVSPRANEKESMANMPACCKRARSNSNTAIVSMARLCCNLNCSEPGSSGTNNSSSFSPQSGVAPAGDVMPNATPFNPIALLRRYVQSPHQDSIPKYIQHVSLLI